MFSRHVQERPKQTTMMMIPLCLAMNFLMRFFNNFLMVLEKKLTHNRLIVMDDIFGLAEGSKAFASFLTIACKFNHTCDYIFHVIYPESIWRTILSQTSIFNISPASVSLAQVRKILECICIRKTRKNVLQSAL